MGIPLIGYASYCFNLAIDQWIKANVEYADIIHKMNACMIQLWQLNNGEQLWLLTNLCTVTNNVTQWSGKYDTGKQYI